MIKGQLVEVSYIEKEEDSNWWEYGVITEVFDDRVSILTEGRCRIMWHLKKTEGNEIDDKWFNKNIKVSELFKNNQMAMAKKNIFGKFKIKIS